jgi:uncharacterized membrane protein
MKRFIGRILYRTINLYNKLNYMILTIVVLGILDFAYYEFAVTLLTMLAPELAPIIGIIFIWIIYKGIKRYYKNQKGKKYSFF